MWPSSEELGLLEADTERGGKPSASGLHRLLACPGSWLACLGLPEEPDTAESAEGTRRHALLEDEALPAEDVSDEYLLARANALVAEARAAARLTVDEAVLTLREERLWLHNDAFRPVLSGRLDLAFVGKQGGAGLVVDYKTLYGDHGHAADNVQLMAGAVLLEEYYGARQVTVALIQPMLSKERQLSLSVYGREDLRLARERILAAIERAEEKHAPRIAGRHCEFCRFRHRCPECLAAQWSLVGTADAGLPDRPVTLAELDRLDLGMKLIADYVAARKRRAMEQLRADPFCLPGWKIQPGRKTMTVADVEGARNALAKDLPAEDWQAALSVKLPSLIKPWQLANGCKSQQVAKAQLMEKLAPFISVSQSDDFLKRA